MLADQRTNSIIAAGGPLQMNSIREVIAKLDIRSPDAMQRIHVYRLKNADVSEMIQVLGGLIGGGGGVGTLSPTTGRGSLGRRVEAAAAAASVAAVLAAAPDLAAAASAAAPATAAAASAAVRFGGGGFGGGSGIRGGGMMGGSSFGAVAVAESPAR